MPGGRIPWWEVSGMRHLSRAIEAELMRTLRLALERYHGAGHPVVHAFGPDDLICFPSIDGYVWPFDIHIGAEEAHARVHLLAPDGSVERTLGGFRVTKGGMHPSCLDLDRTYILVSGLLTNLRPQPGDCPMIGL